MLSDTRLIVTCRSPANRASLSPNMAQSCRRNVCLGPRVQRNMWKMRSNAREPVQSVPTAAKREICARSLFQKTILMVSQSGAVLLCAYVHFSEKNDGGRFQLKESHVAKHACLTCTDQPNLMDCMWKGRAEVCEKDEVWSLPLSWYCNGFNVVRGNRTLARQRCDASRASSSLAASVPAAMYAVCIMTTTKKNAKLKTKNAISVAGGGDASARRSVSESVLLSQFFMSWLHAFRRAQCVRTESLSKWRRLQTLWNGQSYDADRQFQDEIYWKDCVLEKTVEETHAVPSPWRQRSPAGSWGRRWSLLVHVRGWLQWQKLSIRWVSISICVLSKVVCLTLAHIIIYWVDQKQSYLFHVKTKL